MTYTQFLAGVHQANFFHVSVLKVPVLLLSLANPTKSSGDDQINIQSKGCHG